MKNGVNLKFYILISIIIFTTIVSIIFHLQGYSIKGIINSNYVQDNFPIIYILLFIISAFFPLPFLTFVGAVVFTFSQAFIYSIIGNVLTFSLVFGLTRWLGRGFIEKYEKKYKNLKHIDTQLDKNAFRDIVLLRFFFIIPPEAVNVIGGLSKMSFSSYFLASLTATIPLSFASILLIQSKLAHNTNLFVISLALMIIMLIIPFYYIKGLKDYCLNMIRRNKK